MNRRLVVTATLAVFWVTTAHAETLPTKGMTDQRIRTALYSPDEVYRLYGFVGFHLDIEFEAGESFTTISGGDLDALTYSAHDNVLTLKPKVVSADMNLAVTTSKRRYYFEYTASLKDPSRFDAQAMYAVRFRYPAPPPAVGDTMSPEERIKRDLALAAQTRPRNIDYWYCGDPSVKPLAASDDGVHTRLRFGAKGDLPALFVRNDDGSESLFNFSVDAGDVVIHRVAPRLIVRRGKLTGCIVNKGFVGAGDRLDSGTIAPTVTRDRKDERP
jgi:type IV secretion system protein VirB9